VRIAAFATRGFMRLWRVVRWTDLHGVDNDVCHASSKDGDRPVLDSLSATTSTTGGEGAVGTGRAVEEELIRLEREWADAGVRDDTLRLAQILADDFIGHRP
jgi:hypothetical protein